MKLISLLVLMTMSLNTIASSGTIQALESHIDEYHYSLTVEWDQKNESFYKKTTDDFFNNLSQLVESEGLSKEDVLQVAEKKLAGKGDFESLKLKLASLSSISNGSELAEILRSESHLFYSRGASWDGDIILYVGGGLVVVALIAYAVWHSVNYQCIEYDYKRKYGCESSNCYEKYCKEYQRR